MTAQYGKNHLGDLDEMLPTNHGFDEFLGNLYHLNAEQEPEHPDYPQDAEFKKQFGPRGVIKSTSDGKIQDTGPLTIKRMKTIDDEVTAGPSISWSGPSRRTTVLPLVELYPHAHLDASQARVARQDRSGSLSGRHGGTRCAGRPDSRQAQRTGLEENTIVMYSTDNGAECFSWPDGGSTPFRNEKNSNWEGGYRVPCLIRWPGVIKPGTIYNDVFSHEDMLPTLLAAAGEPDIKEKLVGGFSALGRDYKVHLDGYNLLPYQGRDRAPRKEFFYWTDGGDLCGLRYGRWKIVFQEQRAHGLDVWQDPLVTLRFPKLFCLRTDPYERADHEASDYGHWRVDHAFVLVPAQGYVARHLATFKEFPPRQKPGSFSLDQVLEALQSAQNQQLTAAARQAKQTS